MHSPYIIAHSTHDQLKTRLALSTSCNMSCASLNKLNSTDKAHGPELSFVADCAKVCLYIALHCLALTALHCTSALQCRYCIALHQNNVAKHVPCILYDITVNSCTCLQATQRRLACREVAQLVNCAVDDLTGDRRSGHDPDPSPEEAYPRDPPSGSAEGHYGSQDNRSASGHHEAGPGDGNSPNSGSAPSGDYASGSGDWRGGVGGYDGVCLRLEMPQAEGFEYQQGSQLHAEASQVPFSDCTESESESEIPPWEEDSPLLSASGQQLSVGEREWAAELDAHHD